MNNIKFQPWVGKQYEKGLHAKRVLVLGESHYCSDTNDAIPSLTQDIIKDLYDANSPHEPYKNTYTKFVKALVGRDIDFNDKQQIWNSIAFYNFVQVPISGARVAPTPKEFQGATKAFFEVIEELQPHYIIAWGQRLYDNLPDNGFQGKDLVVSEGESHEIWCYTTKAMRNIPVLRITHPSAGFSWDVWHTTIMKFLAY